MHHAGDMTVDVTGAVVIALVGIGIEIEEVGPPSSPADLTSPKYPGFGSSRGIGGLATATVVKMLHVKHCEMLSSCLWQIYHTLYTTITVLCKNHAMSHVPSNKLLCIISYGVSLQVLYINKHKRERGNKEMTDRQLAISRAKEAYRFHCTHAMKTVGFALCDDHYKFFDIKTKYCVELKLNGALIKAFK